MKKILYALSIFLLCFECAFAELTWSTPTAISTSGVDASQQQVAMDVNGNAIAIWVEAGVIKSSYLPFGGSWSSPPDTLSSIGSSDPQIGFDGSGNAIAVWIQSGVVTASAKPFGGSWSATPTSLSSTGSSSVQLAVDSSGNAVAVWNNSTIIQSVTKLSGGNWSATPDVLSSSGAAAPQVAIGDGTVIAVWYAPVSSINTVFAISKTIGGSWGTAQTISSGTHQAVFPQIAIDGNGNAEAIWFRYNLSGSNYSDVTVRASYFVSGGSSWTTPVSISDPGVENPANQVAHIAFDANGNAIAIWTNSYDGVNFNIESATQPFNQAWTSSTQIWDFDPYSLDCSVSAATTSDAFALFMATNPGISILSNNRNIASTTATWHLPVILSGNTYNANPRIGTSQQGNNVNTVAIWSTWDGSNIIIQAATGIKDIILPPTNLSVSQVTNNFGVFTEYANVLTWTPSVFDGVIGYRIYRNGVFIDVINVASQFTDHNQAQGVSLNYAVTAIDADGDESTQATASGP